MFQGIKLFTSVCKEVFADPKLFSWFKGAALKTFLLSLFIGVFLAFLGSFGLAKSVFALISNDIAAMVTAALFVILYVVAFVYFSGSIGFALMTAFISIFINEEKMISCLLKKDIQLKGKFMSKRSREIMFAVVALFLSLLCFPMFFLPLLIPLAVLIIAWSLGKESLALGDRLCAQAGYESFSSREKISNRYAMGIGLVPSVCLLLPAIGWMFLPLLYVAGLKAQLRGSVHALEPSQ